MIRCYFRYEMVVFIIATQPTRVIVQPEKLSSFQLTFIYGSLYAKEFREDNHYTDACNLLIECER